MPHKKMSHPDTLISPSAASEKVADALRFCRIPAGEFLMGSEYTAEENAAKFGGGADWYPDEFPRHRVHISRAFDLAATHVTRGQFRAFVDATGFRTDAEVQGSAEAYNGIKFAKTPGLSWQNAGFEQTDQHPAVMVSWADAAAYCTWLGQTTGITHRLPTEAEWEYAYRLGALGAYTWGDGVNAGAGWANAADATARSVYPTWTTFDWFDGFVYTAPAATFLPSRIGLYDMSGNAWQWCSDWHAPYDAAEVIDPVGPVEGTKKILRGGSWFGAPPSYRAAWRSKIKPTYRGHNAGFRVLRECPESASASASENKTAVNSLDPSQESKTL